MVTVKFNKEALNRALNASGSQAQKWLDGKATELKDRAQQIAQEHQDTGRLAQSIQIVNSSQNPGTSFPTIIPVHGRRIFSNEREALVAEEGTGPRHWPNGNREYWPKASIELVDWAVRNVPNLIRHRRDGSYNLYMVQKYIHDHGTPARHYMRKAILATFPGIQGIRTPPA